MAINFPSNPNVNDTHTVGSTVWTWNGTSWTGQSHDPIEIATLTYPSVDGTNGQVLTTDGAGNLTFGDVTLGSINNLSDVDITSVAPTDGQVLVWSTVDSKFVPGSNAGYSDSAVDTHLNTSTATSNQVLSWDGADYAWVAQSSGGGTLGASISGVEESFSVIENATGTVTHDCDNGHIFYHKTPSADWTVNLTNLGLTNHYATAITIIIQQGATAYIPNALQIGGASTGIRWASDTTPTGNANSTDQVTFSIMTDGTTTFALGQLSTYGEGTGTLSAPAPQVTSTSWYGDRGIYALGDAIGINTNVIEYFDISTPGNATDFGDSTQGRRLTSGCSDSTYGVFGGGRINSNLNTIDYITIATISNAQDFGDLTVARLAAGSCSDGTYGLWGGGQDNTPVKVNTIDYITIASPGNAQDFGDLTDVNRYVGACADDTYGLFAGGDSSIGAVNVIQYVTIASPSNAQDFGDLLIAKYDVAGTSNDTYGVFFGGDDGSGSSAGFQNVIEYNTIATPGNGIDFGDLSEKRKGIRACSDGTYAVAAGGTYTSYLNIMEYVTIATPSNATDFGDLTAQKTGGAAVSGSSS